MSKTAPILSTIILVSSIVGISSSPSYSVHVSPSHQLEFLSSFETLESLGFTPDGVTYSPQGARLMIVASADSGVGARGVFEVTQDGMLVDSFPQENVLFGVTRVTSGPKVNHFFMPEYNGLPTITVFEYDPSFNVVNSFSLTGSASPGDGIAFNHHTQRLVVADGGSNELIEVTTTGDFVRIIPLTRHVVGMTFNQTTGTYFTVGNGFVVEELSTDGELLHSYDLSAFGVKSAVGIASGQSKLFIADEGDPPNTSGTIFIFRSPRRQT